jgi:protein phosphatase
MEMNLTLPELALVLLVGPSGSGKSTFARRHFKPTQILSSDFCRGLVRDDENDQAASRDAFDVLHLIAARRLAAGRLTVIDATNLQGEGRRPLLTLAGKFHVPPVAVVFALPEDVCQRHNQQRPQRVVPTAVVTNHWQQLQATRAALERERYHHVYVLDNLDAVAAASVQLQPLPVDRRHEPGPFDVIGDVHGCFDELVQLLGKLGYEVHPREPPADGAGFAVRGPEGRKVVFVGDLVDRGPRSPAALRLVMSMVKTDLALCVRGNHDDKLLRKLQGRDVRLTHGLAETLAQLDQEPRQLHERVRDFLEALPSHYVLDGGQLVVAHAGLREEMQGRMSERVRVFALYGDTTGETDAEGLPVRRNWAAEYRGRALVVYGHTPVLEPIRVHNTINIDTGCVFGGKLTALRHPEQEVVSVPAARQYCPPHRQLLTSLDVPTPFRIGWRRPDRLPPGT